MNEILIVGRAEPEIAKLRATLGKSMPDYRVRFSKTDKNSIQNHLTGSTKLAIFNMQTLPEDPQLSVKAIRQTGFSDSLLMLADVKSPLHLQSIKNEKDTLVLPKPFDEVDLSELSKKMIYKDQELFQRQHARFRMNEVVGVEAFGVSGKIGAKMMKLGKGGAQLQLEGFAQLELFDIIQVHVQLRHIGRYHQIPAQIVNTPGEERIQSGDTFGVSWLNQLGNKRVAA